MKFITFGKCSWNMIYPLLVPIVYIIRIIINTSFSSNLLEPIPFFLTFLMHCGELLGGICGEVVGYLLKRSGIKAEIERTSPVSKPLITILQRKERKGSLFIYFIITLYTLIDSISVTNQSILSFYDTGETLALLMKALQLFASAWLSNYLLKIRLHKHQLLSFIIILIGVSCVLATVIDLKNNEPIVFAGALVSLLIINAFGIAFYTVGQKYVMEREFFLVSTELIIEGLIGSVLNIGFLLLAAIPCTTFCGWCKFIELVPNTYEVFNWIGANSMRCLLCFLSVSMSAILNLCYIATNKLYNPSHRAVSDVLSFVLLQFYYLYMYNGENKEDWRLSLQWIGSFLLLIGNFIFNEYFIIYFCSLEENTKKEIRLRSQIEYQNSIEIVNLQVMPDEDDAFNIEVI